MYSVNEGWLMNEGIHKGI